MSLLTREMAKKILEERNDRNLAIPDGITELSEDFAKQFDEEKILYYFLQIEIPASVSKIPCIYLTDVPTGASESRLECFDNIIVDDENPYFSSMEGVLFTKDRKRLICYPCGKADKQYVVPEGVEVISIGAFSDNHFLKEITLPSSLKTIEAQAFYNCYDLKQVRMDEGLEKIGEEAFLFCEIPHLLLPKSLKEIHWSNALGWMDSGIEVLEIPESGLEFDFSGYREDDNVPFMPPLFLTKNSNMLKIARRYDRNYFSDYRVDENGIIWSQDGETLIEFPLSWKSNIYVLPENISKVFRWAFNASTIGKVLSSHEVEFVGKTGGEDFSRLTFRDSASSDDGFFVVQKDLSSERDEYVLISYSSQDYQKADFVRSLFKENKIKCWRIPYDIPVESEYAHIINDALENCACLVLLLTSPSNTPQSAKEMVEKAVIYEKPIIPVQTRKIMPDFETGFNKGIKEICHFVSIYHTFSE